MPGLDRREAPVLTGVVRDRARAAGGNRPNGADPSNSACAGAESRVSRLSSRRRAPQQAYLLSLNGLIGKVRGPVRSVGPVGPRFGSWGSVYWSVFLRRPVLSHSA